MHAGLTAGPPDRSTAHADFLITRTRTYLNSAYIAPCPTQVTAAGQAFLERKGREPLGVGDLLRQVGETKGKFAKLVNAAPDEVAMLYATTEGENIVARSIPWTSGDNVVVDDLHYEAAFVLYRRLEKELGIELRIVPSQGGAVGAKDYEPFINDRTRLVSIAWISSVNGFRHDVRPIADLAHAHGALVYADAIQAVGMIPVDVKAAGVDALCAGTYKWLLAGFGIAPFYLRKDVQDQVRPDRFGAFSVATELPGHRFELRKGMSAFTWATLPFAESHQLSAALDYLESVGVTKVEEHTVALADRLADGLRARGFTVLTPAGNRSSIVTFGIEGDPKALSGRLAKERIDVTVREAEVRVSPALFNTADEVDHLLALLGRR